MLSLVSSILTLHLSILFCFIFVCKIVFFFLSEFVFGGLFFFFLSIYISLSRFIFLHLSLSFSIFLCLSLPCSTLLYIPLYISAFLYLSIYLSLFSISIYLSIFFLFPSLPFVPRFVPRYVRGKIKCRQRRLQ